MIVVVENSEALGTPFKLCSVYRILEPFWIRCH